MAIEAGTQFVTYNPTLDLSNKTSAVVSKKTEVYTIEDINNNPTAVFQNLVAQGTSDATISVMGYGVNVFTTATATDYATKLPQPTTGRSTKIINNSSNIIMIYPSNVGGKINNLAILFY